MEIQFRSARPDDVSEAVPLIYSAGPSIFDYIFAHKAKGPAQAFLKEAFVNGAGDFAFQNHTVAVIQEQVVGIGTYFSGPDVVSFNLSVARQILVYYGPLHCWNIMWKGVCVEQILEPPKGVLHYITHIGVSPAWRCHGIGTQLLVNLLEQGKAAKRTVAALDVAIDNPRAQALYERLGFVIVGERNSQLSNEYGKVGSFRRMEKHL